VRTFVWFSIDSSRLPRSPRSNTGTQPGEVVPHTGQPWKCIVQLSEFDLKLRLTSTRLAGEDCKDELGSVDNLALRYIFEFGYLTR